ncbi:MAG: acetolactate synthase large subunit [Gammaproteobacteria bacterium]|nr:acetolactate synthase large subunit [Gammaproteobacteria bacterium]
MNGAQSILKALEAAGVEICFANPGTSEMHLVSAIDRSPVMRPVLALFEGVVSGAADGYARMSGKPAACLLHLGPGFANAMANIHNASRAGSPMINLVGDHATFHLQYDAPLNSDIEAIVSSVSDWTRRSKDTAGLVQDMAEAIAVANSAPGKIASLIVPADLAWSQAPEPAPVPASAPFTKPDDEALYNGLAALVSGQPCALMLGGNALVGETLETAGRIAATTGAKLITDCFPARLQRGAGVVPVERIPYFAEMAVAYMSQFKHLVIVGNKPPVAFFAYPGKPSWLTPEGCHIHQIVDASGDLPMLLTLMAEKLSAGTEVLRAPAAVPPVPQSGPLTVQAVAAVVANMMPEDAIVSDEAATSGMPLFPMTAGAARHEWLCLTGGAIGQGLPLAAGAAIACPERKVLCMSGDGGAMYTVQTLWTMARENLDVVTVIYRNNSYAILNIELMRTGAGMPGEKAQSMLSLENPELDWVAMAQGMGVPGRTASTVEEFTEALAEALARKGPSLIEAVVPPLKLG